MTVDKFRELREASKQLERIHKPEFFRTMQPSEKEALEKLLEDGKVLAVHDELDNQLHELIKIKNPSARIKPEQYGELIKAHLAGRDVADYGVWVYYPWSQRLVHMLDHDEFVEVRTNRNRYKITDSEQEVLNAKKIGIIGLSVGQSIALTLAMERGFGELRLADFDTLELSNLNRIRAGVHNLGTPKVVVAAREIAEIDPFLNVSCFFEGITDQNMEEFFTGNGKLDLLVDECDGLDIKILARFKARELRIPVLMDTSDRGMLDVERFDLDPTLPLLHGTIEHVNPATIRDLSTEDKIPIMLEMLGVENISLRAKVSMLEVEQTINTWPQLASSVALGGAVGADVSRRILLDQYHESGRYYIDLDQLVGDKKTKTQPHLLRPNPFQPLQVEDLKMLAATIEPVAAADDILPDHDTIVSLVTAAIAAPSTGNDQPWKWLYRKGTLYLYHDQYRSFSFGDFQKTASLITLGGAYENLYIQALSLGIEPYYVFFPNAADERLVATIRFKKAKEDSLTNSLKQLSGEIARRHTNRNMAPKAGVDAELINRLAEISETIPGAKFQCFTDDISLRSLAGIIGACDKARLLNPEGHYDFVHREMRWTSSDAERTMDGIDIKTLGLGNSLMAAMSVIKNEEVVQSLKELKGGGNALGMLAMRTVSTASALCLITLPKYESQQFFEGGRSMERFWLEATRLNLAVHPLISPLYLFSRILHGNGEGLDKGTILELQALRDHFNKITGLDNNRAEVFLTKIALAPEPVLKAHRIPVNEVLTLEN